MGEEAETCQSVADCPPQPLQDPVGLDPARSPKGSPVAVQEATKSGCSRGLWSLLCRGFGLRLDFVRVFGKCREAISVCSVMYHVSRCGPFFVQFGSLCE